MAGTGAKAAINDNRDGGRPGFVFMNDASPRNVCKGGQRHVESPYNYLRRTNAFSPLNLEELSSYNFRYIGILTL